MDDRNGPITNLDPKGDGEGACVRSRPALGSISVWNLVANPPDGGVTLGGYRGSIGPPDDRRPPGEWPHPCRRESHIADITPPTPVACRHVRAGGFARLADREPSRHERPAGRRSRSHTGPDADDEPGPASAHAVGSPEAPAQQ